MNHPNVTSSVLLPGLFSPLQNQTLGQNAGLGGTGIFGLLNLLFQQTQNVTPGQNPAEISPKTVDEIVAKIAATLEAQGKEPLSPETITQITADIQKILQAPTDIPQGKGKIGLIKDLAAHLSIDLQETPAAPETIKEITIEDLVTLLDRVQKEFVKPEITTALNTSAKRPAPEVLTEDILATLKEKIVALQAVPAPESPQAIAQFKADVSKLLQEKGFSTPIAQQYVAALAKELRPQAPIETPLIAKDGTLPLPSTILSPETAEIDAAPLTAHETIEKLVETLVKKETKAPQDLRHTPDEKPSLPQAANAPQSKTPQTLVSSASLLSLNEVPQELAADTFELTSTLTRGTVADNAQNQSPLPLHTQSQVNLMTQGRSVIGTHPTTQMVSVQLQKNIHAKVDRMTIQLDPMDLGRLDITLKFDEERGLKAHLSVEKPETLALLQRDASYLEKTLQQAGLDLDENALSFDLKHQGERHLEGRENNPHTEEGAFDAYLSEQDMDKQIQAMMAIETRGYIGPRGVNITV